MRREILLPAAAAAGGVLGFGLRRWQLASAYDWETQLFRPGAPATWAILALLALLALAFLALSRGMAAGEDFLPAFRCPSSPWMAVMAASAFLFLGAGILGVLDGMEQLGAWGQKRAVLSLAGAGAGPPTYPLALLLCALLCLPSGLAVLLLGRAAYRGELAAPASLLASLPPFAGLVWLFASHLEHGSDPQLLRYGFTLLAVALVTMAHYDVAGSLFGRQHPRRAVFCALLGSAVGLLTLADGPRRSTAVLTMAFVLSCLAYAFALLRSSFGPPWPAGEAEDVSKSDDKS